MRNFTGILVGLGLVALLGGTSLADTYYDVNGFEAATPGVTVYSDDYSTHITGTAGGSITTVKSSNYDHLAAVYSDAQSYAGDNALQVAVPKTTSPQYANVGFKMDQSYSGNTVVWFDAYLHLTNDGLGNASANTHGINLYSSILSLKFDYYSDATHLILRNADKVVVSDLGAFPLDTWFRITIGANPDPSGDGTATNDRQTTVYVDGVSRGTFSYTDTKSTTTSIDSFNVNWQQTANTNRTENDAYTYFDNVVIGDTNPVPEPATLLIVSAGMLGFGIRTRRTMKQ